LVELSIVVSTVIQAVQWDSSNGTAYDLEFQAENGHCLVEYFTRMSANEVQHI